MDFVEDFGFTEKPAFFFFVQFDCHFLLGDDVYGFINFGVAGCTDGSLKTVFLIQKKSRGGIGGKRDCWKGRAAFYHERRVGGRRREIRRWGRREDGVGMKIVVVEMKVEGMAKIVVADCMKIIE